MAVGDARPVLAHESRWVDRCRSVLRHQRISDHVNSHSRKRRGRIIIGLLGKTCVKNTSPRRSVFSGLICPCQARRSTEVAAALRRMAMVCLLSWEYSHCYLWLATTGCDDSVESGD